MASAIQEIQDILAFQKQAGHPSQAVCTAINNLKDLCDLNTTQVDWRRGPSSPSYRNGSSGSHSSFPRNGSLKSLNSTTPPESPVSAPYSPVTKTASPYANVRYQSQFKNSSQPVEDKIMNNIILSKLNKFSPTTYNDIREFLYQILGSGEPDLAEMIRQFMLLVFKKAASEEIYCSLYAKLISEISSRYGVILEEMHKLQENYLTIFDHVEQTEKNEDYQTFVEKNIERAYRRGYSQFIAELSALEIIKLSYLEQTFTRILDSTVKYAVLPEKRTLIEEYADCLLRMSRVFKKKSPFLNSARASLSKLAVPPIELLIKNKDAYQSLSTKARFNLMDVKDNLTA